MAKQKYMVSKGLFSITDNLNLVHFRNHHQYNEGQFVSKTFQPPLTPEKCSQLHTDCANPTINEAKIRDTKSPSCWYYHVTIC